MLVDCLSDATPLPTHVDQVRHPRRSAKRSGLCCVIPNVLSGEECRAIIARAEAQGFAPALLNIGGGRQVYAPDTRNSERVILDDELLAQTLFARIRSLLPNAHKSRNTTYPTVGLNERFRILRYQPGHDFKPHTDGCYVRPDGRQASFWTVMIYLNHGGDDAFAGGATVFHGLDGRDSVAVVPQAGSVLVFDHDLYHEGQTVTRGTKYAMRTDVMFQVA